MRVAKFFIPQMVMAEFVKLLLQSKFPYKICSVNDKKQIVLEIIYLRKEIECVTALEEELERLIKVCDEGFIQIV